MQGVSEVEMRERIAEEVVQGDAIEHWLKAQRAREPEPLASAARTWFEEHRESLRLPERARVSHLFLTVHDVQKPDRSAEIAELHRKLRAGEATLESLAAKFSEDARSKKAGGSLGWISRDRVPEDFAEQVFALPLRKASAPFRTKLGWHIVVVHERQAARLPAFAEVRDEIVARLDQAWREQAVRRLMEELRAKANVEVDEAELGGVEPGALEG
jgi:parvulin-like peptidyl-prolyl isomerase